MSTLHPPSPVCLFVSVLFRRPSGTGDTPLLNEVLSRLEHQFGPVAIRSPLLSFAYTNYYEAEMGPNLGRCLLAFERLVPPDSLVAAKHFGWSLEKQLADNAGHRQVNVDPGLLSLNNLVLATGKPSPHRIYLAQGVYADLTLLFQNRHFQGLPWTYPDYASAEFTVHLTPMREYLRQQLKTGPHLPGPTESP